MTLSRCVCSWCHFQKEEIASKAPACLAVCTRELTFWRNTEDNVRRLPFSLIRLSWAYLRTKVFTTENSYSIVYIIKHADRRSVYWHTFSRASHDSAWSLFWPVLPEFLNEREIHSKSSAISRMHLADANASFFSSSFICRNSFAFEIFVRGGAFLVPLGMGWTTETLSPSLRFLVRFSSMALWL